MTFLTPVYKKLRFVEYRDRLKLYSDIEEYINKHFDEESQPTESVSTPVSVAATSIVPSNKFMSFDSEILNESEIDKYTNHPVTAEIDATLWWMTNRQMYPKLFKLFKKISSIPATTGSSERDFSLAGNIVTDKRCMILPKNVDDLIVARNFL